MKTPTLSSRRTLGKGGAPGSARMGHPEKQIPNDKTSITEIENRR